MRTLWVGQSVTVAGAEKHVIIAPHMGHLESQWSIRFGPTWHGRPMLYLQSNALPSTHLYTCTWLHDQSSVFSFFFFIYDLQAQQIKSSKYISLTQICTTFFISYWSVLHLTARHVPDHHAIEALHTWKCSCQFKRNVPLCYPDISMMISLYF